MVQPLCLNLGQRLYSSPYNLTNTRRTDHLQLDHLYHVDLLQIPTCRYEMLCTIFIVHIYPGKHALDQECCTARTRQHDLDHTDHTDEEYSIFPGKSRSPT